MRAGVTASLEQCESHGEIVEANVVRARDCLVDDETIASLQRSLQGTRKMLVLGAGVTRENAEDGRIDREQVCNAEENQTKKNHVET